MPCPHKSWGNLITCLNHMSNCRDGARTRWLASSFQDPAHAPRRPGPATVCCSVVTVNRDQHRELLRTFLNRRNELDEIQKFRHDPASVSEETKLPSMLPTIYRLISIICTNYNAQYQVMPNLATYTYICSMAKTRSARS